MNWLGLIARPSVLRPLLRVLLEVVDVLQVDIFPATCSNIAIYILPSCLIAATRYSGPCAPPCAESHQNLMSMRLDTGSRQLQSNAAQPEPTTPISAMKAALRPGSGNLLAHPPLMHALDSGSLSQPLLYGKSADGSLSESGDKSSLPKAPVIPELAETFAILSWWLRLQGASAVAHPSWVEALSSISRSAHHSKTDCRSFVTSWLCLINFKFIKTGTSENYFLTLDAWQSERYQLPRQCCRFPGGCVHRHTFACKRGQSPS